MQYYQGWINPVIHDPEIRKTVWRLDPEKAGISSCIGDIGTHAFQMTEYLTGMEVKYVLSDLNMLYDDNELDLDGTILIRFSEKVKGVIRASQIATGEENGLTVAVYGKKGAFKWEQENPNILYHITDDEPKELLSLDMHMFLKLQLMEQNYPADILRVYLMLWVISIKVLPKP